MIYKYIYNYIYHVVRLNFQLAKVKINVNMLIIIHSF